MVDASTKLKIIPFSGSTYEDLRPGSTVLSQHSFDAGVGGKMGSQGKIFNFFGFLRPLQVKKPNLEILEGKLLIIRRLFNETFLLAPSSYFTER